MLKLMLPEKLLESLQGITGYDKRALKDAHARYLAVASIRINKQKLQAFNCSVQDIISQFSIEKKVPWCDEGYYLKERPAFILDPLIHAGAYYVQEASSMFLYQALQQLAGTNTSCKVLDLCAAPGGKTTLLASFFNDGLVVSNEVIKPRANVLYENVVKWGASNTVITNSDATEFSRLKNYFDFLVIDAPCSGSGLFRKDADAVNEWSLHNVELCSQRQQRIIADAYNCLKQDGYIIYSTCSFSREENENILDWLKENFSVKTVQLKLEAEWNICEVQSPKNAMFGYRFWPDKVMGEGFFMAILQKTDGSNTPATRIKNKPARLTQKENETINTAIKNVSDFAFFKHKEDIHLIQKNFVEEVALLQQHLYVKKAGINAGSVKGNDFVPNHELALSTAVSNNFFKVELSKEEALKYLRKQALNLETGYKGLCLCTFKNLPLGWAKILHNRVNNFYPVNWRILKL